jgi:hypothetical protein
MEGVLVTGLTLDEIRGRSFKKILRTGRDDFFMGQISVILLYKSFLLH